jgi:MOB kinase activator 1
MFVDGPHPAAFLPCVTNIFRRLFRIYAHIYHHHFLKISELECEAHLNTTFKHFVTFVLEFSLIPVSEMEPLQELVAQLVDVPENSCIS